MPYQSIRLRPGIDVEQTPTLNSSGWSSGNLIRFYNGLPQMIGGWQHISTTPLVGVCRELHAWADLTGVPYIACGTNQRLELFQGGTIYDITPIRATSNISPSFSTVMNSTTVKITDTANGAEVGDWVNINVPVSVGGIVLQGFYLVTNIVDANNYDVVAAMSATSTVNNGGAVPVYDTTNTLTVVKVTLSNHGYSTGDVYTNQVATTVGGVTLSAHSSYTVGTIINANSFDINPGQTASGTNTGAENGGDVQIMYLIASGPASDTALTGYGIGAYGAGPYGMASGASIIEPLRQWFLDNFGQILIGNYTGSTLYQWVPPNTLGNVATIVTGSDVPQTVNISFVSTPTQQMIVLGSDPVGGGSLDPNLVRFSDVGDYTVWTPLSSNQAGSYRLPSGSRIVGGLSGPQYILIWTDVDVYLMNYIGAPLVWSFTKISSGCNLLSSKAAGVFENIVVWAAPDSFFIFDGNAVRVLPCTVYDYFFNNLNRTNEDKVFCAINSYFSEATWYFPSNGGTGEIDSYVKYNIRENIWDYGTLERTAWVDENVYGAPIGVDQNGILQQHETGYTADGSLIPAFITSGNMSIAEGSFFTFVERVIGDFVTTGGNQSVAITFTMQDYPNGSTQVYGPYTWTKTNGPPYSIVRGRGRVMSITISSNDLGSFWRVGDIRYNGSPAGSR